MSKRARSTFRILPRSGRIAWIARLRPCLAEPPAESPSTMNSSDSAGSRSWQSASLPGSELMSSAPLRRVSSRALRAASRAAAASTTLATICAGLGRMLLEPLAELVADHRSRPPAGPRRRPACPWSARRTSGSGTLTDSTQVRPSRHVVAGERDLLLLGDAALVGVLVDRARQRAAEAGEMRAAVALRDVVGEAQHGLVIAVVPLHRDFDRDAVASRRGSTIGGLCSAVLVAVEICDEGLDAALVVQLDRPSARRRARRSARCARRSSGTPARAGDARAWRSRTRSW